MEWIDSIRSKGLTLDWWSARTANLTVQRNGVNQDDFSGPVPNTHWVLPNVLCGHTPNAMSIDQLKSLIDPNGAAVNVFICLDTDYNYRTDVRDIALTLHSPVHIRFLHCPAPDFGTLNDSVLAELVFTLEQLANDTGNVIYLHCHGGHGRSTTVLANFLVATKGFQLGDALKMMKKCHSFRRNEHGRYCTYCDLHRGEFEDPSQKEQAVRMEKVFQKHYCVGKFKMF